METPEQTRLRHAACLLSDIGWRAHPDYRGEQSLNIIAHASFVALERWQMAYLPVYSVWAAFVVIVFPPLFGYA